MAELLELFKLLAWRSYFLLVNVVFEIYNYFIPRECVSTPKDPLILLSAKKLTEKLRAKEVRSVEIVKAYIKRIDEVNPVINAAINKNFEDALDKAQKCDDELEKVEANSEEMDKIYAEKPLFGVPFTVKDSMEYAGLNVTCGIPARRNVICTETAVALKNVCNAGAILLTLTNVPEMCMWLESSNPIYGRSKNPYDTRRSVGGSSGGEGALLAAAGSVIGVGSDIGGSIRLPALFNGVFGLKTSQKLVCGDGHVPIGCDDGGMRKELAVIGPLCRYASDLPLMLKALSPETYTEMKVDEPMPLEGLRVYYVTHIDGNEKEPVDWEIKRGLYDVVRFLEMEVGMRSELVHFSEFTNTFNMWMAAMSAPELPPFSQWATDKTGDINLFAELLKSVVGQSEHTLPVILGGLADKYPPFDAEGCENLRDDLRAARTKVHELLADNAILVFPGYNTAAQYHNQPILTPYNLVYSALWNCMGTPVAAVPLGLNRNGIPVGCQVVGAPNSERLLVSVAQELEKKFGGWTPPRS